MHTNSVLKVIAVFVVYCIFNLFSLIYIHENNVDGLQSDNCYFSYNSNKLRQDVALRERASEFQRSFIVLAFFNGVNMKHAEKFNHELTFINPDTINKHSVFAITHADELTGSLQLFINSTSPERGIFLTERQALALSSRINNFLTQCLEKRCSNG